MAEDPPVEEGIYLEKLLILVGVIAAFIISTYAVVQNRLVQRRKALRRIPRKYLPVGDGLMKKMYNALREETERAGRIRNELQPEITNYAQLGFGEPAAGADDTHLKTTIAKSFLVLELAATHQHSYLQRHPTQTVSDYVRFLEEQCSLEHRLCTKYIKMYEQARFSRTDVEYMEFASFMKSFFLLLNPFDKDKS